MFERDLTALYGVEIRGINRAVRRNADRFPAEFCFHLDDAKFENWR